MREGRVPPGYFHSIGMITQTTRGDDGYGQ